jgi:O-antigen/teichoic acid export membrane protein
VLKFGMGSIGVVTVNLVVTILCRLYFVLYVFIKLKLIPKFSGIEIGFIKEIVVYSTWILLQMVATQLNASVDQILIGSMVATSATILAIYSVGTQIVQYFQTIGNAFSGILMPGIVSLVERGVDNKKILSEMIRIGRMTLIILGLVFAGYIVCGQ